MERFIVLIFERPRFFSLFLLKLLKIFFLLLFEFLERFSLIVFEITDLKRMRNIHIWMKAVEVPAVSVVMAGEVLFVLFDHVFCRFLPAIC